MQPVQDLTVEDRVSRTQYQYTLEDADANELIPGRRAYGQARSRARTARRRHATSRRGGLQATLVIDRDTASRLGITPQMIDDTLYDAFGQRQVSTIFTQLNQYHVVLEVEPAVSRRSPDSLDTISTYIRHAARRCRSSTFTHSEPANIAAGDQSPGTVSGGHDFLQPGARRFPRRRGAGDSARPNKRSACRPASRRASRARPRHSRIRSRTSRLLILAALITVYIVLGVLYESYIHPDHDSLHAALRRRRRHSGADALPARI